MNYGGSCPYCRSTDIADTTSPLSQAVCLDCDKTWLIGGKKRSKR